MAVSAVISLMEVNVGLNHWGTVLDNREAFFTAVSLFSFIFFQMSNPKGFWINVTFFFALMLSIPDIFGAFNAVVWNYFYPDNEILFGLSSLILLGFNIQLRRKGERIVKAI